MKKNRSEWIEILDKAGVPCGPINKINEVWNDPQIKYREMRIKTSHPKTGEVDNIGVVSKFLEHPSSVRSPAPTLGEHTEKVLEDFGYDKNKTRVGLEYNKINNAKSFNSPSLDNNLSGFSGYISQNFSENLSHHVVVFVALPYAAAAFSIDAVSKEGTVLLLHYSQNLSYLSPIYYPFLFVFHLDSYLSSRCLGRFFLFLLAFFSTFSCCYQVHHEFHSGHQNIEGSSLILSPRVAFLYQYLLNL